MIHKLYIGDSVTEIIQKLRLLDYTFQKVPDTQTISGIIKTLRNTNSIIIVTRKSSYELFYDKETEVLVEDLLGKNYLVDPLKDSDSEQKQLSRIVAETIKRSGTTNTFLIHQLELNAADEIEKEISIQEIMILSKTNFEDIKDHDIVEEEKIEDILPISKSNEDSDEISNIWDKLLND